MYVVPAYRIKLKITHFFLILLNGYPKLTFILYGFQDPNDGPSSCALRLAGPSRYTYHGLTRIEVDAADGTKAM